MKGLFHAGKYLSLDMASTIFFVVLYESTRNLVLAVALGMVLGIVQIGWVLSRGKRPDAMQWLSLFLVLATGTATFLTKDPRFILFKPTLIYVIVGAVMLKPGWMNRYLPDRAIRIVPDLGLAFGYVWAAMMFATGALNLFIALRGDMALSVKFLAIFPLASKLSLFAIQYAVMQFIGRRRYLALNPESRAAFDAVPA
ncbi:MAG: inner membrane-spanning protein YciB [Caulobacteraceae bacterium]